MCWGDRAIIVLWEVHKPEQAMTLNSKAACVLAYASEIAGVNLIVHFSGKG